MAKTSTPITVTEMLIHPAGGPNDHSADRIVARFANWEDARLCAARWSQNSRELFYRIRFNDGFTIATENFMYGIGGDYIETHTPAGRKMRAQWNG